MRARGNRWGLLVLPAVVFLAIVFVYPTLEILLRSVTYFDSPQSSGLDNFLWFFETDVNLTVLWRTLWSAGVVTAVCLGLGYPYAYLMTVVGDRLRMVLLGVIVASTIMSLLVRSYAWVILLQAGGPIGDLFALLGLGRPALAGTLTGALIAMCQVLLPLMILPLYAVMRGIDRRLVTAAASLGASPARAFRKVYLPLSLPGVLAGTLLVFVMTMGFFVTPTLVGSPSSALISQLIESSVSRSLAWGHAGAISVVVMVLTLAMLVVVRRGSARRPDLAGTQVGRAESSNEKRRVARLPLYAIGALVAAFASLPVLVVVPISLAADRSLVFPPDGVSLQWYENLFTDPQWYDSIVTSLRVGVITTLLATVLGAAAAFGLVRGRFPGRGVIEGLILAPMVVPLVIFGVGVYAVFLDWKLVGSDVGFVLAHSVLALPFVVVAVQGALTTFDRRLESAAQSLGAPPHRVATRVTMRILAPAIATGALFAFVESFDETVASLFLADSYNRTLPVQMYNGVSRQTDPTVAAASTVIVAATLAVLLLFAVLQRRRSRALAR
jgi:putative spermidine/putrescine transport system permease protein